ncbi:cysteine hydrolase family protein [Candidatus Venteria ishoeyi]|uniref:Nicotinamidase/pyrazinamidase n=1 Tax=Candidatus Venteria ishoeyi TaxID=1899563 RepID=A0A1H6FH48_9GAMM|nr:isochorismatase family protein [Candidatus Venteria ishoeyi]SEH08486.1 nicotinamidase/pyrazinamidase [Candidatus Venteria ishoeyi]
MNLQFLIIDPQNDFAHPDGSLFVPGADKDSERLADMIKRHQSKISDIHITLDSHHLLDIAHPLFWIDSKGQHPAPFTCIHADDVDNGKWRTTHPGFAQRATDYVQALKQNGRYDLIVWPPHCLIGASGNNVVQPIAEAVGAWEAQFAMVDYVTKGSNIWTEHYSAVQADVPDPEDPGTQLNTRLIEVLQEADLLVLSGQALSHCVANTVRDVADNFGDDSIHKMVLIEDTCSPVPGFEQLGADFLQEMKARGMRTGKSTEYFA